MNIIFQQGFRKLAVPITLALTLLLLSHCDVVEPCQTPQDCKGGAVCNNGRCTTSDGGAPDKPAPEQPSNNEAKQDTTNKEEATPDLAPKEKDKPETPIEQTPPEKNPDTASVVSIDSINGAGTEAKPAYPPSFKKPADGEDALNRFADKWVLTGKNLDQVVHIKLCKDQAGANCPFGTDSSYSANDGTLMLLDKGTNTMKTLTLPQKLTAGMFFLLAFTANNVQVASAKTFILQGEKGDPGIAKSLVDKLALFAKYLTVTENTGKDKADLTLKSANLHIQSGTGSTDGKPNSYGNLVIGYNGKKSDGKTNIKTGSHNLIVGDGNSYTSYGGIVAGQDNTISGAFTSITGGFSSTASGKWSSVTGGHSNQAKGEASSITGGGSNKALGARASVTGGSAGIAMGEFSTVSGGRFNIAGGNLTSQGCKTTKDCTSSSQECAIGYGRPLGDPTDGKCVEDSRGGFTSVVGGSLNIASKNSANVTGGKHNWANGESTVITGGEDNRTYGTTSTIVGGRLNTTGAHLSASSTSCKKGDHSKCGGISFCQSDNGLCAATCKVDKDCKVGEFCHPKRGFCYTVVSNSGSHATIIGGEFNISIGTVSHVGGGSYNTSGGRRSVVQGGELNYSLGEGALISGGVGNVISASGQTASILGGNLTSTNARNACTTSCP